MLQTRVGVTSERCWQALAWGALLTAALLLASLFQAGATAATGGVAQAEPATIHVSTASPALANDDDTYAHIPGVGLDPNRLRIDCEPVVGQPLYAGLNTWVTQTHWQCVDLLP
jgi:hypothetical protein